MDADHLDTFFRALRDLRKSASSEILSHCRNMQVQMDSLHRQLHGVYLEHMNHNSAVVMTVVARWTALKKLLDELHIACMADQNKRIDVLITGILAEGKQLVDELRELQKMLDSENQERQDVA